MATLFSKADLNKFWHDVQNEVTLICAKFGISKVIAQYIYARALYTVVIGRKTKWPRFFWPTLYMLLEA